MVVSYFNGTKVANPPDELVEFMLCKEFGWTINELYEQPESKVQRFIQIITTRNEIRQAKAKNDGVWCTRINRKN